MTTESPFSNDVGRLTSEVRELRQELRGLLAEDLAPMAAEVEGLFGGIRATIVSELTAAATEGKLSVRDLVSGILEEMARLAVEDLVRGPLEQGLAGLLTGGLGSGADLTQSGGQATRDVLSQLQQGGRNA